MMACIMTVWEIILEGLRMVVLGLSSISDIIVALIAAFVGKEGLHIWKYKQQYPEKCKAAKAFSRIVAGITPSYVPEIPQIERYQEVANHFWLHEQKIMIFLLKFSHVLPRCTRNLLLKAMEIAEEHKIDSETEEARNAVDEFYQKIHKACDEMFRDVQP